MPVAFDDLIPATGEKKSLSFDDLIPSDSGQGAAFQAADEQQAMEREAGRTVTPKDVGDTLRPVMNFPGKVLMAASAPFHPGGPVLPQWPTDEEVGKPLVPPEVMKYAMLYPKAADFAAQAFPDSQIAKYPKAVTDAMANTGSGFTSAESIGLLGLAPEGKLAQRLVAGTFLGQSIVGSPEQWQAFNQAKSVPDKIRIATEMGLSLALPSLALAHSRAGEVPKEKASRNVENEPAIREDGSPLASSQESALSADAVPSETYSDQSPPPVQTLSGNVPQPEITTPIVEPSMKQIQPEVLGEKEAVSEAVEAQGQKEPFVPSTEWQEIPEGTVLPNGGEYRFDQKSGKNFARWKPENLPKVETPRVVPSQPEANPPNFSPSTRTPQDHVPEASPPRGITSEPIPPSENTETFPQPENTPTSAKNAITNAERENRNIAPAVEAAKRDFGAVWDEAERAAAADPTAPERLATEIAANPRALTDHENALLLRRQIEVQNEHDAAIKAVNEAPDETARADASVRLERARDELQTVYDAAKSAGTETGRGLNARKMLANNDFSLSKMEAEYRAVANNGKALNPRQAAEIKALHERIHLMEGKLASYEARDAINADLKRARAARKPFSPVRFLEEHELKAKERIIARRGKLFADPIGVTQVAHLADEAIIGAAHIARGVRNFKEWSKVMVTELGERITPYLRALFAKSQSLHSEAARLAMAKSRTVGQTVQTLSKIGREDFTSGKLPPIRPDRELMDLRANLQRAKDEYAKRLERARRVNMPLSKKVAETFVRAERASKLTGITTIGKLFGAGFTRLVTTPIEEGVGAILSKSPVLRRIAAEAPREGGMSLRAEGRAVTSGIARGVRNIPKILKGQRTNEEALYGKQGYHDTGSWLDLPGRAHGAIKSAFKEAERERSTIKRQQSAQRKGIDPTEAATEQEIGQAAHMDAQRAIFMQDNVLSDVFRGGVRMLENSKRFPTAGFYMAKIANFLLPIVKVPTNVALETATHLTGTVTATGKLIQVMSRGVRNIKPGEADMIMRHYKKGMVGAALFFTGYFNANKFGGFYQKGEKRDPNDVRWGGARIAGVNIPPWLLHAPAFIALQAGATAYRMQHQIHKGEEKGRVAGALAVAEGLAHEIPFVNEMSRLDKILADGYEGTKARGDLLRSSVVPQGVQNIAGWTDAKDAQGNPVRRKPATELDYLKYGIPGLRQQVPLHEAMKQRRLNQIGSSLRR